MKKKFFQVVMLMLVVTLLVPSTAEAGFFDLFFGGENKKATGTIELKFWNGFTAADGDGMQKMVNNFNKLHKGEIKVTMQTMNWGTYYQKVVTALSSGNAPDIGVMHIDRLPEFSSKGVLTPLDSIVQDLGWDSDEFAKRVWQAGKYKGTRYGIPLDMHPLTMYINVDMFKKAGLNPNKPPQTREEFMKVVKKLTKDTNGDGKIDQYGTAIPPLWPGQQFIVPTLIHQFGGSITNEEVTKVTFDSPEAIKAVKFAKSLIYKHKVSPANIQQDGEVTLFKQGRLGIHFNGIWMIRAFQKQKGLNFMSYPVPNLGGKMAVMSNSHNFVIFNKDEMTKKRKEAAAEFIKYISKRSAKWAKFGQIPARNSVRKSDKFQQLKHQSSIAKEVPYVVFPPAHPVTSKIMGPLYDAINLALLDKEPVKEVLNKAAKRAQKALDQYYKRH
ncbi:ABC-type sugar transport system, periplasmic component [Halobacteroides halobius DSM 5150]|uniref:ABC-type sugar transport system, periplasmic component n=1 Tax=Halobacteroides halobius (strain ATCC 35273 / DSM 5150 / MD-1) TaxID=748449 RepID=L0K9P6_HALHC|nr:ABC transporter substrate-binding protein [Halobacteroides halobius]AGB41260.1 ABC-type sugar transport system, periplasmic component [Halobacteroides halobius DSM 5150]